MFVTGKIKVRNEMSIHLMINFKQSLSLHNSFTVHLQTDDNPLLSFSEVFYLKQIGNSLFIMSDMFRLTSQYQ